MRRIAEKVGRIAQDLGSVNQVIDAEVQNHFSRLKSARPKTAADDGNAVIGRALAGSADLNRQLTELSRTYVERKQAMHLTPSNARRVVDTALALTAQPLLAEIGDQDSDAEVFAVPSLGSSWQPALRGLDTRLKPGVWRPITFDDQQSGRTDIVHVHLGHALLQKSARILRSSLFSADSAMSRVTAVVVPGLDQSCVASVSRLVLVGRGGLRLHEEVFLTGIRVKGQAMAEAKVEQLLEQALDQANLALASAPIRGQVAQEWNRDDSRLRTRLLTAMTRRAERHQEDVTERLDVRRDADIARAREIFAAFRLNLQESRARLRAIEAEESAALWPTEQLAQVRRDIRAMDDRLTTLSDEETREIAAIRDRYTDIRPHVSAAAVVFALTPEDAERGVIA